MLAYGSIAIRHSKDIDMLVPEESIFAAAALLERSGYRRVTPNARLDRRQVQVWIKTLKHFIYIHDGKRIEIELHWRLSDNPLLARVPAPSSWREIEVMRGMTLPTLGADDLFAYLCAHGPTRVVPAEMPCRYRRAAGRRAGGRRRAALPGGRDARCHTAGDASLPSCSSACSA